MKPIISENYALKIILLLGMLTILGCAESTEPESESNVPDVTEHQWYRDIVASVEDCASLHSISIIYRYNYEGQYFFEVENPLFSCLHCYIYDSEGNLAEFANSAEVVDFVKNRNDKVVIWMDETCTG